MSKAIARLLDQPEQVIKKAITILEDKNGYPSQDVRHLADNIQKIRYKLNDLGFDPDDTTAQELYHALHVKFQIDSHQIDKEYGSDSLDFDNRILLAADLVNQKVQKPNNWVVKATNAKAIYKSIPPKKIMKNLGYRSVDSMLKRENLGELSLMTEYYETSTWNNSFQKKLNSLDSSSFELRPLKIIGLTAAKWGIFDESIVVGRELGVIGLLPDHKLKNAPLLSLMVLLADSISGTAKVNDINSSLAWWADMDGLLAGLPDGNVSMAIQDVSANHCHNHSFTDRVLDSGRQTFWHGLVNHYDNLLTAEEDLGLSLSKRVPYFTPKYNQPAFEYAEDLYE